MKSVLLSLLFCWLPLVSQAAQTSPGLFRKKSYPILSRSSRFERFVDKLFDDADTNHDGSVSYAETYALILKIYVHLNRQAPIPPPNRKKVLQLFWEADQVPNRKLSREEFHGLAKTVGRRALSRLLAHKLVTLLGAPLLAAYLVRLLSGKEWLPELASTIVPQRFHEKVLPVVTSKAFCRTVLIVALVATLGNIVMKTVNWILDLNLINEETDPKMKKFMKKQGLTL